MSYPLPSTETVVARCGGEVGIKMADNGALDRSLDHRVDRCAGGQLLQ